MKNALFEGAILNMYFKKKLKKNVRKIKFRKKNLKCFEKKKIISILKKKEKEKNNNDNNIKKIWLEIFKKSFWKKKFW